MFKLLIEAMAAGLGALKYKIIGSDNQRALRVWEVETVEIQIYRFKFILERTAKPTSLYPLSLA